MDRESKKLVCPECGSEDIQIYTDVKPQNKFPLISFIVTIVSFAILIFNFILTLIPSKIANSPNDYSSINTTNFWIINIIIPLIIFAISLSTFVILHNIPRTETKYFCRKCKKKNIENLKEITLISTSEN